MLRRVIFNVFFYGSHFALFAYGWYSQATNTHLAGLNSLQYSVWISRGAGLVLAYDGGLIMLPMLRNIIRVLRPKFSWLMAMDENVWLCVSQTCRQFILRWGDSPSIPFSQSSPGCIFDGILGCNTYDSTLCQLYQGRTHSYVPGYHFEGIEH